MFGIRQCYAPIEGNKRCINITASSTNIHCEQHKKKSSKLHSEYKAFSEKAKTLSLDEVDNISTYKEKVKYLMRCYSIFRETYNLRMKFKTKYITPGYSDDGHEHQFVLIKSKIEDCENRLEKLHDEFLERKTKKKEQEPDAEDIEDVKFIEEIRSFKKKKIRDEKETNEAIAFYIKENRELLKEKRKKVDFIEKYFAKYKLKIGKHFNNFAIASLFLICFYLDCLDRFRKERKLPQLDSVFKLIANTDMGLLLKDFHLPYLEVIYHYIDTSSESCDAFINLLVNVWKRGDFQPETHSLFVKMSEGVGLQVQISSDL